MAEVRPFQGLRFSRQAGSLSDLVAPPYDVISPEHRERLAESDPHNVVRLTLPEHSKDDRSKFVRYVRSAQRLEEWRREGVLERDDEPSVYRLRQRFVAPGETAPRIRTAIIGLIRVVPFEQGVVLPHERTFPKHKEDRLRILEATRAHLESIFGLVEDDDGTAFRAMDALSAETLGELKTEDGVDVTFERVRQAEAQPLLEAMADRRVWIADGHHRYETALAFREKLGEKDGSVAEDYMVMALSSVSDPGLALLPTHRVLKRAGNDVRSSLEPWFRLHDVPNAALTEWMDKLSADGKRSLGIALPGGQGLLAEVKDLGALVAEVPGEGSDALRRLDVTWLHDVVFAKGLGLTGHDFFDYTRDPEEAVAAVEKGSPGAFLTLAPSVDDMRAVAGNGERMPQKSTYYYPKLPSGLVLWSLKDFTP